MYKSLLRRNIGKYRVLFDSLLIKRFCSNNFFNEVLLQASVSFCSRDGYLELHGNLESVTKKKCPR